MWDERQSLVHSGNAQQTLPGGSWIVLRRDEVPKQGVDCGYPTVRTHEAPSKLSSEGLFWKVFEDSPHLHLGQVRVVSLLLGCPASNCLC